MIELPREKVEPSRRNPHLLTLFGASKVGKTTMLSLLDNCLILDTEKGTDLISALKVNVNNLKELDETLKAISKADFKYDSIALDTIDNLVMWIEAFICKREGVKTIGDIPYGAGYGEVRDLTMKQISRIKKLTKHVIVIGHRKKTIIGTETVEVNTSSLDLSGKLKNIVMADSDAIGYVFRDEEGNLKVSFESSDELEAGSRCEHLKGQVLDFKWSNIYVD